MSATTASYVRDIRLADLPAWQAALARFHMPDPPLGCICESGEGTEWEVWSCDSYSARRDPTRPAIHTLILDLSDPLVTRISCDCDGARGGHICQHQAGVAKAAHVFPVVHDFVCARCGHVDTDPDQATRHWLLGTCRRPAPAVGAAVLSKATADRKALVTHG